MRDSTILFIIIFSFFTCFLSGQEYIQVTGDNNCIPDTVYFSLNPDSIDTDTLSISLIYIIGSNNIPTNDGNINYVFTEPGNHYVKLVSGLNTDIILAETIVTVRQNLNSDFDYEVITDPLEINFFPTDTLIDTISNYSFVWTISQDTLEIDQSAVLFAASDSIEEAAYLYTFPDTGTYTVSLQTQRSLARCESSNSRTIIVQPEPIPPDTSGIIPVANYFVPDAHNYFIIDPNDQSVILSFKVYSRTGVLVFTTESEVIYWDGRNSSGQELGTGVYYYVLEAIQGDIGNTKPYGFIHLFRE
jgi:hypothetical protein